MNLPNLTAGVTPQRDEAVWEPQGGRRGRTSKNISSARFKVPREQEGFMGLGLDPEDIFETSG